MNEARRFFLRKVLQHAPFILFLLVLAGFGIAAPVFLSGKNLTNIVIQSSSTAIIATGMTFVLLTGGVDLSIGAIMFIAAALGGKLLLATDSFPASLAVMLLIGTGCGAVNATLISTLRVIPFIVTLATLYVGRGLGLWITETRAMNMPDVFLEFGARKLAGVPLPVLLLAIVVLLAQITLSRTAFGRQIYAIGANIEGARKAGIKTRRILFVVYVIAGFCAALGAIISLGQIGAVSPKFGENREFAAIAAAVLGGTSLFGGRGAVLPGTLLGALLIQSVENGLVVINADPYLYPLVTSTIIFVAVLLDSARWRLLERMGKGRRGEE